MKRNLCKILLVVLFSAVLISAVPHTAYASGKKDISEYTCSVDDEDLVYTGKALKPEVKVRHIVFSLKEGKDYKVTYKNNKNAGKASATITGIGKYTGTKKISFTIARKSVKNLKFKVTRKYYYTGKKITPSVVVKNGKKKLKRGTDYTISCSNNKNPGKAKVTIKGKKNYSGSKSFAFYIAPKTTAVKVAKRSTNSFSVKWGKVKGASGYYIACKRAGSGKYKVKALKSNAKKFTSAKSNTTYIVKVRAYKKVGSKKILGKWSKAKKITTKKKTVKKKSSGSGSGSNDGVTVYITNTGSKYHYSAGCRGLRNAGNVYAVSLSKAISMGLELCGWE